MKKVYNNSIKYHKMTFEYILTSNFVKVTVSPIYVEEHSIPYEDFYIWIYSVKIKNQSQSTIQLLSRHWQIIDYTGKINEVSGIGVVGKQPIINSGETFKYNSSAYLNVPSGIMQGTYEFIDEKNTKLFKVMIPPFSLDSPYLNIRPH
jgi:ApaG protein